MKPLPHMEKHELWWMRESYTGIGNRGVLTIGIGFGAHYTILIIRNPQNNIGNDLGRYMTLAPVCCS